jgi:hypothetical protein
LKVSPVLLKDEGAGELACNFPDVSGRARLLRFLLIEINGSLII